MRVIILKKRAFGVKMELARSITLAESQLATV
jgi:hypothetical protein